MTTRRQLFGLMAGACVAPYLPKPPELNEARLKAAMDALLPGKSLALRPTHVYVIRDSIEPGLREWFARNHNPNAYDGIFD